MYLNFSFHKFIILDGNLTFHGHLQCIGFILVQQLPKNFCAKSLNIFKVSIRYVGTCSVLPLNTMLQATP